MNRLLILFAGILAVFLSGWAGFVLRSHHQLAALKPQVNEDLGEIYPQPLSGIADRGRQVYASNGCVYCHTQQVRPSGLGSDIKRGWGDRRTVARDYLYDKPVLLGASRTGPDLTNIGARKTDAAWFHRHLYNPRSIERESNMPPYRFLYETRRISGQPSADALKLTGRDAPAAGYEVVPKPEAVELVSYLMSLKRNYPLPEVPKE